MRLPRSNRLAVAFLVLTALSCADQAVAPTAPPLLPASSTPRLGPSADSAFAGLRAETMFVSSAIGIAASPSMEGRYFRTLIALPNSADTFRQLWREGADGGRLYALLGLKLTDSATFQRLAPILIADQREISAWGGCVIRRSTVSEIASSIARGEMDHGFDWYPELVAKEAREDSLARVYARERR